MPNSKSSKSMNVWYAGALFVMGITVLGFRLQVFHESASDFKSTSVPQGTRSTFWPTDVQGPANGRCEIVAPNGAVVASFVSIAGGMDNGWRAQVISRGFGQIPKFTVEVPKNTPVGDGYRICTATYLWPQSSARFDVVARGVATVASPSPFVPTTIIAPTATPVPARQVDLAIRNAGATEFVGAGVYDRFDGDDQLAEQVAIKGRAAIYQIRVQNRGKRAASFRIRTEKRGTNWKLRYFDALSGGREITSALTEKVVSRFTIPGAWETPVLPVGGQTFLRLEISAQSDASVGDSVVLRVDNEKGETLDAVSASVSRQSIARLEFTINQGKTWKTTTVRGISAPRFTVVGLRVVKSDPKLDWPEEPFRPQWRVVQDGESETHLGEDIWVHCDTEKNSVPLIVVRATCGNSIETKIRITPEP